MSALDSMIRSLVPIDGLRLCRSRRSFLCGTPCSQSRITSAPGNAASLDSYQVDMPQDRAPFSEETTFSQGTIPNLPRGRGGRATR